MDAFQLIALLVGGGGLGGVIHYLTRRLSAVEAAARQDRRDLDTARAKITELELQAARVPILESQVNTLTRALTDLQDQADRTAQKLDGREKEIARLQAERDQLRDQLADANRELQKAQTTVEAYERAMALAGIGRTTNAGNAGALGAVSADQGDDHEAVLQES